MEQKFFQEGPQLENQFRTDPWLQSFLKEQVPTDLRSNWVSRLDPLGADAAGLLFDWADQAERQPPVHLPFDAWGKRVDHIQTSEAWQKLADYASTHGLITEGYERAHGPWSRVLQMLLLYLYHPSSAMFSCPLAMTDGAARALEVYGDEELKQTAFKNLTSRNPQTFWTSGQWMTETTGGSDVGASLSRAVKTTHGYQLYGSKWFTSATTSQMAMTLARAEGAEPGGRGLSLFYVKLRGDDGQLQNIRIDRLKNKLGTKALPTAELELTGTPARLLGSEGGGVKKISTLFNITRLYNAVCAVASMRRALALLQDYARRRRVFGKLLAEQPLHAATVLPMWAWTWACTEFVFDVVRLWGREDTGTASEEETALLRLYTPLAKLYTGKKVAALTSEAIEAFGGAGYIEDTGLPKLLRDAQVLSIWEGTTNVLSLDTLRALTRDCPLSVWSENIRRQARALQDAAAGQRLREFVESLEKTATALLTDADASQAEARHLAFALTEISMATLMCTRAQTSQDPSVQLVARYLLAQLKPFERSDEAPWRESLKLWC